MPSTVKFCPMDLADTLNTAKSIVTFTIICFMMFML